MSEISMADSPALVSEYLANIDDWTSEKYEEKARQFAERAELTHPINNAPSTIAASSVYFTGCMVNEKQTQQTVSDASGVSVAAIRECYQQIAEAEGIASGGDTSPDRRNKETLLGRFRRVTRQ